MLDAGSVTGPSAIVPLASFPDDVLFTPSPLSAIFRIHVRATCGRMSYGMRRAARIGRQTARRVRLNLVATLYKPSPPASGINIAAEHCRSRY